MKAEVITWIFESVKNTLLQCTEVLLRVLLFFMPLGFYMCLLQFRNKVSSTRNLSTFTNDNSVWQHIFPGFILVAIDPDEFKSSLQRKKNNFQLWISSNKYILCFLFCLLIVVLMVWYGNH